MKLSLSPTRHAAGFAIALATFCAAPVLAQGFPNKPVTIVVPFAPGGGTDLGARLLAQKLGAKWGQSVVIDNKGGAGGIVGVDAVVRAKPEVPTVAESGLTGFDSGSWLALLAPAGMPPELVNKIAAEVKAVLDDDTTRQALFQQGANPRSSTPAQLAALIESDRKRYARIITEKNISID